MSVLIYAVRAALKSVQYRMRRALQYQIDRKSDRSILLYGKMYVYTAVPLPGLQIAHHTIPKGIPSLLVPLFPINRIDTAWHSSTRLRTVRAVTQLHCIPISIGTQDPLTDQSPSGV